MSQAIQVLESGKTLIFFTTNAKDTDRYHLCALQSPLADENGLQWIKSHFGIRRFFAASGNTVKSQTWTVVSVYALVAIVKKRPKVEVSRYTLLQIFSFTHFEKMPIR